LEWKKSIESSFRLSFRITINPSSFLDKLAATISYNYIKTEKSEFYELVKIPKEDTLLAILEDLYHRKISSIIIEGGAKTLQDFIDLDLWDEARVFTSENTFEKGISAPKLKNFEIVSEMYVKNDLLTVFRKL
jgi:diaminohydroxyphosphoribosylaminopyrimidine deaminase / 5-amino-6-(5-phosphoribosylamino)uracil reductase